MSVGELYNRLLDSNEGDLSPHTSQAIYFSKTNENKMSDKEVPVGEVIGILSLTMLSAMEVIFCKYLYIFVIFLAYFCCCH